MITHEQIEKVLQLVEQYGIARLKCERWRAMAYSGIGGYLKHHNENFGWETYWARFYRLQDYAAKKIEECFQQQEDIMKKIAIECEEGA